jgi:superfamily II DNA or RNA helicase
VREPLRCRLAWPAPASPAEVLPLLASAAVGPGLWEWVPPAWLLPHQVGAARCIAARLNLFRGALLADAVGLGKTYVALAVATRYPSGALVAPAALLAQWRRVMDTLDLHLEAVSHEALSRGFEVPAGELLVVDEAHRFCNPDTRRYAALARAAPHRHVLLLSATPVVNRARDLVSLLRLWLPDHGLAVLGVPSMAEALAAQNVSALAHAAAAVMVARSREAVWTSRPQLPEVRDAPVLDPAPVEPAGLDELARHIARLEFPSFADRQAAELLRLHLWHRLASSAPALGETLRRHLAYLDRAIAAAQRGEALSRSAARALFGPGDDLQLELEGWITPSPALDVAALAAERERLRRLQALLASVAGSDPKADALQALLATRAGSKTLIFTTAVATALHLARRLRWHRVAVATARGARIASGPAPLEQVLAWFAPRARHSEAPSPTLRLDTLIATDLLSEGLDLQDAEAVVHYDLPWSPLRLAQRLGRVARLGCDHRYVGVWWFQPCRLIEQQLALGRRLDAKASDQLRLGVPTSGAIGRAWLVGGLLDWRQWLAFAAPPSPAPSPREPLLAVVRGPRAAAVALRWIFGSRQLPELVVLEGEPPRVVQDEAAAGRLVAQLSQAAPSPAPMPATWAGFQAALGPAIRWRLTACLNGPYDEATTRLSRSVVRAAARAARLRDHRGLRLLDQVLDRLHAGLPAGPIAQLESMIAGTLHRQTLARWVRTTPLRRSAYPEVALAAALVGDGSLTEPSRRRLY